MNPSALRILPALDVLSALQLRRRRHRHRAAVAGAGAARPSGDRDPRRRRVPGAPSRAGAGAPPPRTDGVEVWGCAAASAGWRRCSRSRAGRPVVHGPRAARMLARGDFDVVTSTTSRWSAVRDVLALGGGVKLYEAHEHWLVCRRTCSGDTTASLHRPRVPALRAALPPPAAAVALHRAARAAAPARRRLHRQERVQPGKHREFGFPAPMEVVPYFLPDARRGGAGGASLAARAGRTSCSSGGSSGSRGSTT
jgi:hypothetical protein